MKELSRLLVTVVLSISFLIILISCGHGNETIELLEEQEIEQAKKIKKKFALTEFLIPLGVSEFEYTVKRKDKEVIITGGIVEPVTQYPLRIVLNSDNKRRLLIIRNETTSSATIVLREDTNNYPKRIIKEAHLNRGIGLFGGSEVIVLEPNKILRVRRFFTQGDYYFNIR